MVLGGDRHARHGVALQPGHVDHVVGLGNHGGQIEGQAALGEEHRLGFIDHGLLAAIGVGPVDEVDAGKLLAAAVVDGGWNVADGVEDGDVGRCNANLLDELAQQRLRELRRNVGIVGAGAVVVHLVQVHLDDDLLALLVADRALAVALVEVDEDLVPRGFVGGGIAHRADRPREHRRNGLGVRVAVVPPAWSVGHAIPAGGLGIEGPGDAARLDAEGRPHRRVGWVAGAEGGLGHGRRGLGQGRGNFQGSQRCGAAHYGGFQELSSRSFKVTVFHLESPFSALTHTDALAGPDYTALRLMVVCAHRHTPG